MRIHKLLQRNLIMVIHKQNYKKIKVNSHVGTSMVLVCVVCGDDLTEKKKFEKQASISQ